jgi:hypothetical protein
LFKRQEQGFRDYWGKEIKRYWVMITQSTIGGLSLSLLRGTGIRVIKWASEQELRLWRVPINHKKAKAYAICL